MARGAQNIYLQLKVDMLIYGKHVMYHRRHSSMKEKSESIILQNIEFSVCLLLGLESLGYDAKHWINALFKPCEPKPYYTKLKSNVLVKVKIVEWKNVHEIVYFLY